MANNILIDIGARTTRLNRGLRRSQSKLLAWARRLTRRMVRAGMNMGRALIRGMRRGLTLLGGVGLAGVTKSLMVSSEFERSEIQLEALIGSAKEARKRMSDLEDVALDVTFDLTSLVKANRHLTVFTENLFAGKEAMMLIADAASVTPNEIQDVAFWFGRAYSMIQSGRPMGEAVMRLTEMGLMSSEAAMALERLSKSYSPQAQQRKLEILIASLMRFEGANEKLLGTLSGQFSLFRDATTLAFKDIGDAIAPMTKVWLKELIAKIREFRTDGTFQRWGENISSAILKARIAIEDFIALYPGLFKDMTGRARKEGEAGWAEVIADQLERGLSSGIEKLGHIIESYLPRIIDFGITIGKGLAKGIGEGMEAYAGDKWWYKWATGFSRLGTALNELDEEYTQGSRQRKTNRQRNIDFGARIAQRQIDLGLRSRTGAGGNLTEGQLARLGERGFSNMAETRKLFTTPLPVRVVTTEEP